MGVIVMTVAPNHLADLVRADELAEARAELAEARSTIANLEIALRTSREIGTAIGILMASRKVTADRAFELLRTASQHRHVKLRDLAEGVILTGTIDLDNNDRHLTPRDGSRAAPSSARYGESLGRPGPGERGLSSVPARVGNSECDRDVR